MVSKPAVSEISQLSNGSVPISLLVDVLVPMALRDAWIPEAVTHKDTGHVGQYLETTVHDRWIQFKGGHGQRRSRPYE